MAFVQNWLHVVWATKNRHPFLEKEMRIKVFAHILENALSKRIYIDKIGGEKDHVHCLLSLNADQNLSKVMQLIKGEA